MKLSKSFISMEKSSGLKQLPCGTPISDFTVCGPMPTWQLSRYQLVALVHKKGGLSIFLHAWIVLNLHALSKACLRSIKRNPASSSALDFAFLTIFTA